jgi:predicted nucleic acid-binding protein
VSAKAFLDTNVLVYALAQNDPRKAIAKGLLATGGAISVQVLNEFVSVARRKLNLSWAEIGEALAAIRTLCDEPIAIDLPIHDKAVELARQDGLAFYDALIVAAALAARCEALMTEDLQDGREFENRLRVENPFRPSAP